MTFHCQSIELMHCNSAFKNLSISNSLRVERGYETREILNLFPTVLCFPTYSINLRVFVPELSILNAKGYQLVLLLIYT